MQPVLITARQHDAAHSTPEPHSTVGHFSRPDAAAGPHHHLLLLPLQFALNRSWQTETTLVRLAASKRYDRQCDSMQRETLRARLWCVRSSKSCQPWLPCGVPCTSCLYAATTAYVVCVLYSPAAAVTHTATVAAATASAYPFCAAPGVCQPQHAHRAGPEKRSLWQRVRDLHAA